MDFVPIRPPRGHDSHWHFCTWAPQAAVRLNTSWRSARPTVEKSSHHHLRRHQASGQASTPTLGTGLRPGLGPPTMDMLVSQVPGQLGPLMNIGPNSRFMHLPLPPRPAAGRSWTGIMDDPEHSLCAGSGREPQAHSIARAAARAPLPLNDEDVDYSARRSCTCHLEDRRAAKSSRRLSLIPGGSREKASLLFRL